MSVATPERVQAQYRTTRLEVPPGEWFPPEGDDVVGWWLVDGLVQREVTLARSVATEVLGPQDLVARDGADTALLEARVRFFALTPVRLRPLDAVSARQLAGRPEVVLRLLDHAAQQCRRQALHRAVSQLPRVEERLLGMLWLTAERWGRMAPDGVAIGVRLPHEALGRMVGARRPTVTLALRALIDSGKLGRRDDGTWLLDPATQDELSCRLAPAPLRKSLLQPDFRG